MGGTSRQQSQSSSQSVSNPWAPAQPALQGILSGVQSQLGNYQPNALENSAYGQLTQNAQNLPNYAPQATNLANKFLTGDPTGLLNPALQNYNAVLDPIATANLDPTKTPGIQSLLDTIRGDVSNSVNGMFAGAGRDLSGLNQQTLARGIAQGEAAPLLAQYNQNVSNAVDAATRRYGAAGQTAGALGENQGQAFNFADMIPALQNASPMGVLNAQSMQRAAPLQNLGMLANLSVPIAGLGGQVNSNSQSSGSYTASPMQTALGWGQALGGSQGGGLFGAAGTGLGLLRMLPFSDRRLKTDISKVGELFDGTPVYRFRYIDNPVMHVGLMADEVTQDAVHERDGFKVVDYEKATERAASMGGGQ